MVKRHAAEKAKRIGCMGLYGGQAAHRNYHRRRRDHAHQADRRAEKAEGNGNLR